MEISLPPNTQNYAKTGTIQFTLTPIFLNTSTPTSFRLKMWGITSPITLRSRPSTGLIKSSNEQNNSSSTAHHEISFRITTNLPKLT